MFRSAQDQQSYPRQRQTGGGIYRPDNGNPTHGITATNYGLLVVRWIKNLTEGHPYPAGNVLRSYGKRAIKSRGPFLYSGAKLGK